jgi:hypothetical protein
MIWEFFLLTKTSDLPRFGTFSIFIMLHYIILAVKFVTDSQNQVLFQLTPGNSIGQVSLECLESVMSSSDPTQHKHNII